MKHMHTQRGLSLVELMISITLGLLLMVGVVRMFVSSNTVFNSQQGMSRTQETGRLAMEFIGRDLRMASFSGCRNTVVTQGTSRIFDPLTNPPGNGVGLIGLHRNFTEGLHGYSIDSTGTTDLPNSVATDLGSSFSVATNSDILVIRGSSDRGMAVNRVNDATNVFGYTDQSLVNDCVEGFCDGTIAVVSNCRNGRVFRVDGTPGVTGNEVTLAHLDSWTVTPPSNDIYTLGTITPIHTIVYFVATATGSTTPSLWQKIDNNAAIEILQGVERMGLRYMDKPTSGQPIPPYQLAADVDFWDLVSSVEVELVIRGDNANEQERATDFTFRGVTVSDRYVRKTFKSSFSLRSRNP